MRVPLSTTIKNKKLYFLNGNYTNVAFFVTGAIPTILIFLAMFGATGCDQPDNSFTCMDDLGCIHISPQEPLNIGVLQALSGDVGPLGKEQVRGIELALAERSGNILGHPVNLQIEDTGCSSEGGANAVLKIIADPKIIGILGTTCSSAAASAAKAMSTAGLSMISGNNSAPFLTSIGGQKAPFWQKGYFRTAPNEENAGKTAAIYAFKKLNIHKAATINDGDIYSKGLTDGFEAAFIELGGEITLTASISKGDDEMEPVLTAVINSDAHLLFFPLFQPEGNHILLHTKKLAAFKNITLMSDGALLEHSFLEAVSDKAIGMYFIGPSYHKGKGVDILNNKYELKYKKPPSASYYQSSFDAANLLFQAIEDVAQHTSNGSLYIGRQAIRDALYTTKNFNGITGWLECDNFGDCAVPRFHILRMDNPKLGLKGLLNNIMFSYPEDLKEQ
ncbi:MAG: branched-chain amino acid ABC transporter substrate-binding protein [Desulfobulbaceae bacterium]|nr:branched-chain amino acid ABC transporter substrate-binding protein [Desulfobulbaceae bacterium]